MSRNPFIEAADALAAHGRMERGRVVTLLTDDPETKEEREAELQRQRVHRWNEKKRQEARAAGVPVTQFLRELAEKRTRGPDGRFLKEPA